MLFKEFIAPEQDGHRGGDLEVAGPQSSVQADGAFGSDDFLTAV